MLSICVLMNYSFRRARTNFLTELSVAGRKLRTLFDARARERGLTLPRARLLLFLSREKCMTQTELAAAMEIETPTLVRLIDGLEKQGLVMRRAVEGDRRAKHILLTEDARDQVDELEAMTDVLRRDVLQGLEEHELEQGLRILRHMLKNIENIA